MNNLDGNLDQQDAELTIGEIVQLLLCTAKECGSDSPEFATFLDDFCQDNDNFMSSINDVFVCGIYRQSLHLTNALLAKYGAEIDIDHNSVEIPGCHCPLTAAAKTSNNEILKLLLHRGASITSTTASGETALDISCEQGCELSVRLIIDSLDGQSEVSHMKKEYIYHSGLMNALYHGHDKIVDMFLDLAIDVNLNLDDEIGTPLHRAIEGGSLSCVEQLIRAGADIEALRREVQQTPLMRAAEFGHLGIIQRLLTEGADINRMTEICSSALTIACHYGHTECVVYLIDHGADINVQNPWGFTPLFMGTDTHDIVRILINAGADLNAKCGDRGEAAIHLAAVIGSYDTVKLILDNGANIDIRTDYNETALWLAVWKGHADVCRLLIQRNCTLGVPSNACQVYAHDYTELEVALGLKHFAIAKLLILAGHPLINRLYFNDSDLGPIEEISWVKLREESLQILLSNKEEFKWLYDFVSGAPSLKYICALTVRHLLGVDPQEKICGLNIPADVADYVCFSHVDLQQAVRLGANNCLI